MKAVKLIRQQRPNISDDKLRDFIYQNLPAEMIQGLEYDDPRTIRRLFRLIGLQDPQDTKSDFVEEADMDNAVVKD